MTQSMSTTMRKKKKAGVVMHDISALVERLRRLWCCSESVDNMNPWRSLSEHKMLPFLLCVWTHCSRWPGGLGRRHSSVSHIASVMAMTLCSIAVLVTETGEDAFHFGPLEFRTFFTRRRSPGVIMGSVAFAVSPLWFLRSRESPFQLPRREIFGCLPCSVRFCRAWLH